MSQSRNLLLALSLVLLSTISSGGAYAQADDDRRSQWNTLDLKPFVPPVIPLPPNAQVAPGTLDLTPTPSNPAPIHNPQLPTTSGPGLRITIPNR
jgi:hypothetical protein